MSRRQTLYRGLVTGFAAFCLAGATAAQQEEIERKRRVQVIELDHAPGHHAVFVGDALGRGYLGIEMLGLTEELRQHFGVPAGAGVMVSRVVAGSPAEQGGIRVGDILTAIDGELVSSPHQLRRLVRRCEAGEEVRFELSRDGALLDLDIEMAERERRVVDLRGVLEGVEGVEGKVKLDLGEAMDQIKRYFDGDEWQQRVERFESLDWRRIEERMRAVEERLRSLERELESDASSDRRR